MYLAQRNVPFKIKRSEFFNISPWSACDFNQLLMLSLRTLEQRWGRDRGNDDIANGSGKRLLTKDDANDVVLIKFLSSRTTLAVDDKSIN